MMVVPTLVRILRVSNAGGGSYRLEIRADLGSGEEDLVFGLSPTDQEGLAPAVRAALAAGLDSGELEISPAPSEPDVAPPPSTPVLYAAAQLIVQDGDISGIGINSRFGGAFWGDVGHYYVFFAEPQPDTDYMVMASAGPWRAYVLTSDKTEDMFIVTVVDSAGAPADAEAVNIQILRAS